MQQGKSKNIEVEIRARLDNIAEFKETLERMGVQQAFFCTCAMCISA